MAAAGKGNCWVPRGRAGLVESALPGAPERGLPPAFHPQTWGTHTQLWSSQTSKGPSAVSPSWGSKRERPFGSTGATFIVLLPSEASGSGEARSGESKEAHP